MSLKDMSEAISRLTTQWEILEQFESLESSWPTSLSPAPTKTRSVEGDARFSLKSSLQQAFTLAYRLSNQLRECIDLLSAGQGRNVPKRSLCRLPDELIVEVTKYITGDGCHLLRPLLLVNKKLHALVMSTPSLWSTLKITFDPYSYPFGASHTSFVRACLERAQDCLLHITLEYDTTPTPKDFATSMAAKAIGDCPDYDGTLDMICNAIAESQCRLEAWGAYQRRIQDFFDAVQAVVGPSGSLMARWRSETIHLPRHGWFAINACLKSLIGDTPHLEALWIYTTDEAEESYPLSLIGIFPKLSSVRTLVMDTICDFKRVSINFASIQHLEILLEQHSRNLEALTLCESLQVLILRCKAVNSSDSLGQHHLRLPSLRMLKLIDDIDCLEEVAFSTPILERLELDCMNARYIPSVSARHVRWKCTFPPISGYDSGVRAYLLCLVRLIESMETLVFSCLGVTGEKSGIFQKTLHECLKEQPNLLTIELCLRGGYAQTIRRNEHTSNPPPISGPPQSAIDED